MNSKISKAQKEVWEWKENLSDELQAIPKEEQLDYIKKKVELIVKGIKSKKSKKTAA